MNNILVSVIIPTFGRPDNLKRALKSAFNQDFVHYEVIVVDDNNPLSEHRKDTITIINEFSNENLIYLQHKENKNGAAARNTGINKARGKYITFLDDDDEYEINKLSKQYEFMENHHQFHACYCLSSYYKNDNKFYKTVFNKIGDITADILSLKTEYNTTTLFFKNEQLKDIGGFDESFIRNQDYEILVRFLRHYKIGLVKEYLVKVHSDDKRNQPSFDKYEKIRLKFINEFKTDIEKQPIEIKKNIIQSLYFDLAYYAFKRKKFFKFFSYLLKSKPNINLIRNNLNKINKVFKYFKYVKR